MSVAEESSSCWCCGNPFEESDLVRLGSHPEVGVCFGCARFLHRRAVAQEDQRRMSLAGRVRSGVGGVRGWIIDRGWHRLPIVGPLLRRFDRHLP